MIVISFCIYQEATSDIDAYGNAKGHFFIDIMDWLSGLWFRCNDNEITPNGDVFNPDNDDQSKIQFMVYYNESYFAKSIEGITEQLPRKLKLDSLLRSYLRKKIGKKVG